MLLERSLCSLNASRPQENSFNIFSGKVEHDVNAILIWLKKAANV